MKKLIITAGLFAVVSCQTQRVSVDYMQDQDFSQIHDYQFSIDQTTMNSLSIHQIEGSVQNALAKKGVLLNTDSKVHIRIEPKEFVTKQQSSSLGVGMGNWGRGFGVSTGVGIPIYTQKLHQQFIVGIYNQDNRLVWQGRLDIQMPAKVSPQTVEANIAKGVDKLFKNYPPKP